MPLFFAPGDQYSRKYGAINLQGALHVFTRGSAGISGRASPTLAGAAARRPSGRLQGQYGGRRAPPNLGDFRTINLVGQPIAYEEHAAQQVVRQLDELLRAVQTHPEWLEFAWSGVARYHAGRYEFEEAWQLVRRYAQPPSLPGNAAGESMAELKKEFYAVPGDYAAGYALYRAQIDSGKIDDALATARHFTARPDAPAYFHYLEAEAWAGKQDWERAWRSWQDYKLASKN